MSINSRFWIVTDLDGTLLDHKYDLTPALQTLNWLKENGIPVIPCTSKTASEVREFRKIYGLTDPYIVENGGAIYGGDSDSSQDWEIALGKHSSELIPLLDILSKKVGIQLRALVDLSYQEIRDLTGLEGKSIELATDRKWSVPFLNPPNEIIQKLDLYANELGLSIFKGNRMSHLISYGCDKGQAVLKLKSYMNNSNVIVIALGDSPNDLPLLNIADRAIVVPSSCGPNNVFLEGIKSGQLYLAPEPHGSGWAKAVRSSLSEL